MGRSRVDVCCMHSGSWLLFGSYLIALAYFTFISLSLSTKIMNLIPTTTTMCSPQLPIKTNTNQISSLTIRMTSGYFMLENLLLFHHVNVIPLNNHLGGGDKQTLEIWTEIQFPLESNNAIICTVRNK